MNSVPLGRPNGRLLRGKQDEKPIQIAALQPSRGQIATRQLPLPLVLRDLLLFLHPRLAVGGDFDGA